MRPTTRLALIAAVPAIAIVMSRETIAYTATGVTWSQRPVPYVINTTNMDLPESAVESAVAAGADTWATQSRASIAFSYIGRSAQTTNTNDGLNLVMFRDAAGGAIATTYWWASGSRIIDADIVFWDAAIRFFAGTTGCSGGFYIEDVAAHEFGHALGLGHSTSSAATMYPSISSCSMKNRTLDPDDATGVEFLYPPIVGMPPRAPVNVRIVRS